MLITVARDKTFEGKVEHLKKKEDKLKKWSGHQVQQISLGPTYSGSSACVKAAHLPAIDTL